MFANRFFNKTDLFAKIITLWRIRRMIGSSYFKIKIFTWEQKLELPNDFGSYRVHNTLSVHGELSHHGQFVSPDVILELVILNSHCFSSPKCLNLVDCGKLVQDSGPQSWVRAQSHGCTGPMRHCSDLSDLRVGGLGKRCLDFLLDGFWNTCKIPINN